MAETNPTIKYVLTSENGLRVLQQTNHPDFDGLKRLEAGWNEYFF